MALGRLVKRERLSKFGTVDSARAAAQVSRGAWDNVEAGRRVKDFTLAAIEKALGFRSGSFEDMVAGRRLIQGETYKLVAHDGEPRVGPSSEDADTLLFKRPEGLSDEAWERLQAEHKDYWQWLLDRASRER